MWNNFYMQSLCIHSCEHFLHGFDKSVYRVLNSLRSLEQFVHISTLFLPSFT